MGFAYNDVLSFTEQDDRTVIVRREKICDNCKGTPPAVNEQPDGITLMQFLDGLSADEQRAALIHLSVRWAEKGGEKTPKTLRVLMVEPHESPHELFITDQLDDLQATVGGLIEIIGNGDSTLLVCNEESKLNGMDGNRRLSGDVIAGPFFVVGEDGENFRSLTDEEMQKYMQRFGEIEDISPEEVKENIGYTFYAW